MKRCSSLRITGLVLASLILLVACGGAENVDPLVARSQLAEGNQARLQRLIDKGRKGTPITIAAIGGSITEGALATSESKRYVNLVQSWWNKTFPSSASTLVNAGIGATASDFGSLRLKRDVLAKNPDLVIVEFGVNDGGVDGYGDTYEGLVRQLMNAPSKPAVLLLFMMNCNGYTNQDWQSQIGAHYNLPMVSYFDAMNPEVVSGRLLCADISPDTIHPNDFGHNYVGKFVTKTLDSAIANFPSGSAFAAIPATPAYMRTDAYEFTVLEDGTDSSLTPVAASNHGWTFQPANPQAEETAGWESSTPGSTIDFDIRGDRLLFSYFVIKKDMGQASVSVDGVPVGSNFDGWFEGDWGGYRQTTLLGSVLSLATHRVHVTLLSSKAVGSTGNRFRVLSVGSGGAR